jgi:zinc transporter ZupT
MSILVFIALFSPVLLSGLSVFLFRTGEKTMKLILAFGGGFLFSLTFIELIPEIYSRDAHYMGFFVLLGFFIQLLLDFITKGVEHGHHSQHENLDQPCRKKKEPMVFLGLMIGICIHSFLEGMPLSTNFHNEELQGKLLTGIVIHNIPISIVLASLLLHTGMRKATTILLLLIFAFSSPLGTITSFFLGENIIEDMSKFFSIILAIVVGIFLHISTTILFESDGNHKFNFSKIFVILLGFSATILLALLIH